MIHDTFNWMLIKHTKNVYLNRIKIITLVLTFCFVGKIFGQPNHLLTPPATVTPDAFNFMKYGEIPVSEYTGIATIALPIYKINLFDKEIPITLTYHGGGIRVSEEASWVGLGWDLQFGSLFK